MNEEILINEYGDKLINDSCTNVKICTDNSIISSKTSITIHDNMLNEICTKINDDIKTNICNNYLNKVYNKPCVVYDTDNIIADNCSADNCTNKTELVYLTHDETCKIIKNIFANDMILDAQIKHYIINKINVYQKLNDESYKNFA